MGVEGVSLREIKVTMNVKPSDPLPSLIEFLDEVAGIQASWLLAQEGEGTLAEAEYRRTDAGKAEMFRARVEARDALLAGLVERVEGTVDFVRVGACFGCEGEQFEGFICERCGAVADGLGGMFRGVYRK